MVYSWKKSEIQCVFSLLRVFFWLFSRMRIESKREGAGQDFKGVCGVGSCMRPIRGNRVWVHPHSPLLKIPSLINQGFASLGQTEVLADLQANAADAHPGEAFLLQKGGLGKIKGLWMQKSFDTNCLAGIMTLNNKFKPRAGHGSSQFWLPHALLLTACSTHLLNRSTFAHHHSGLHFLCFSWLEGF